MVLIIKSFLTKLGQTAESFIRLILLSKFKVETKSIIVKNNDVLSVYVFVYMLSRVLGY